MQTDVVQPAETDTTEKLDDVFMHGGSAKLAPPHKPHTVLYVVIFSTTIAVLCAASAWALWLVYLGPQQQAALHQSYSDGYASGNLAGKNFQSQHDQQMISQNYVTWQKQEKTDTQSAVAKEKIVATQEGRSAMYRQLFAWFQNNCRHVQGTALYLCNDYSTAPGT